MAWQANLNIRYVRQGDRTIAYDRHTGPLRVLKALYPEGPQVCHHVLLHPPSGLVAGDELAIQLDLEPYTHAVLTTPGATRYYRGPLDKTVEWTYQRVEVSAQAGACIEWVPLETIVHDQARGVNQLVFHLEPGAHMLGWDLLALGLPAADEPFVQGYFEQHIEWPQIWLERGILNLASPAAAAWTRRLLASPLGWNDCPVAATMWVVCSAGWSNAELDNSLNATRELCAAYMADQAGLTASFQAGRLSCGVTSLGQRLMIVRILAASTSLIWPLVQNIRDQWRLQLWHRAPYRPRIWAT